MTTVVAVRSADRSRQPDGPPNWWFGSAVRATSRGSGASGPARPSALLGTTWKPVRQSTGLTRSLLAESSSTRIRAGGGAAGPTEAASEGMGPLLAPCGGCQRRSASRASPSSSVGGADSPGGGAPQQTISLAARSAVDRVSVTDGDRVVALTNRHVARVPSRASKETGATGLEPATSGVTAATHRNPNLTSPLCAAQAHFETMPPGHGGTPLTAWC
jgi:hypothetical protein